MGASVGAIPSSGEHKRKLCCRPRNSNEKDRLLQDVIHDTQGVECALRERLKELNCLYGISRLVERRRDSLEPILQGIVELLPPSWQFPDVCCAQLSLYDKVYTGNRLCEPVARQSAEIRVAGQPVGDVTVCYSKKTPHFDEGPFLKEERRLIDAVAERIGAIVEHFQMEQQLQVEHAALADANVALRRVLAQIEEEKKELRESIADNVDKVMMPVLRALESEVPTRQKKYVAMLKKHLKEIASPFVNKLSQTFSTLTPVEIDICNMVREGLSTKQIAHLRHVAPATVSKQRERIRRKLHIAGTETNLATHLHAFCSRSRGQ